MFQHPQQSMQNNANAQINLQSNQAPQHTIKMFRIIPKVPANPTTLQLASTNKMNVQSSKTDPQLVLSGGQKIPVNTLNTPSTDISNQKSNVPVGTKSIHPPTEKKIRPIPSKGKIDESILLFKRYKSFTYHNINEDEDADAEELENAISNSLNQMASNGLLVLEFLFPSNSSLNIAELEVVIVSGKECQILSLSNKKEIKLFTNFIKNLEAKVYINEYTKVQKIVKLLFGITLSFKNLISSNISYDDFRMYKDKLISDQNFRRYAEAEINNMGPDMSREKIVTLSADAIVYYALVSRDNN